MSGQQPEKDIAVHLALMLMADIAGMFPGKQGCGPKPQHRPSDLQVSR